MKKFISFILISAFIMTAGAQTTKMYSKTITAADTTSFINVPSRIKSFTYAITKTSGTLAGKVYLEGSIVQGQWVALDSITLADNTVMQSKTTPITSTDYLSYRYRCTNTSSATANIEAVYLRRTDE